MPRNLRAAAPLALLIAIAGCRQPPEGPPQGVATTASVEALDSQLRRIDERLTATPVPVWVTLGSGEGQACGVVDKWPSGRVRVNPSGFVIWHVQNNCTGAQDVAVEVSAAPGNSSDEDTPFETVTPSGSIPTGQMRPVRGRVKSREVLGPDDDDESDLWHYAFRLNGGPPIADPEIEIDYRSGFH